MKFKGRGLAAVVLTATVGGQAAFAQGARQSQTSDAARIARLETLLEGLRQELKIPAYSAAVVKDQKVLWAKGFGYADVENKVPATENTPYHLATLPVVAQIVRVIDNEDKSVAFSLPAVQEVRVFAIGEGQAGGMFDYGWIEDADKGVRVWEMREPKTTHAGGAGKNRQVDVVVTLPAGNYRLRYKSDDSHSFSRWNSLPPDINFWGIAVYRARKTS